MNEDTRDREILVDRVLNAPPELVFETWINPAHISKWYGPNGFTTTITEMDVRPGGHWRYVMRGPDGTDYRNHILFLVVEPPSRLVYRHEPEAGTEPVSHTTTVTFVPEGAKTRVTMRGVFATAADLRHVVEKYGALEGARQTMARFAALVEGQSDATTP